MSLLGDKIKQKIRDVSKGEYDTWGLVSMVFEFIDQAEAEVSDEEQKHIAELEHEIACYKAMKEGVTGRINRIEAENAKLRDWKESALAVEREWDIQTIAKLIGVKWGSSIRKDIEPYIRKMQEENANLRSDVARLVEALNRYVSKFGNCGDVYDQAKEALAPFEKEAQGANS